MLYQPVPTTPGGRLTRRLLNRILASEGAVPAQPTSEDLSRRGDGQQAVCVPPMALTMIGTRRLDNVESCMGSVVEEGVPGDFIRDRSLERRHDHLHARRPESAGDHGSASVRSGLIRGRWRTSMTTSPLCGRLIVNDHDLEACRQASTR